MKSIFRNKITRNTMNNYFINAQVNNHQDDVINFESIKIGQKSQSGKRTLLKSNHVNATVDTLSERITYNLQP